MFEQTRNLKILLHRHFYNQSNIQPLIDSLQYEFDPFSIEYDDTAKVLQIKIKKTNMKKIHGYSHTSLFYYSIFNPIIVNYLRSNLLNSNILQESDIAALQDSDQISLLYNVLVIGDNIINVQL